MKKSTVIASILLVGAVLSALALLRGVPPATSPTQEISPIDMPDPAHIALANAARRHDLDPALLMAISRFETAKTFSPLIAPIKNGKRLSSAVGLCQMIKSTRKSYALTIGKYDNTKPYISHLITEAEKQADACARFTKDQMKAIKSIVGRKPTPGEVYLCHLLGLGGCRRVIKAASNTPLTKLLSAKAIKANPFIRRAKTAGGLRMAASLKIRKQMQLVDVPPENLCRY